MPEPFCSSSTGMVSMGVLSATATMAKVVKESIANKNRRAKVRMYLSLSEEVLAA